MVRQLNRILEIGAVPETPSSGPSFVCSSSPSLLFSVLFPPGLSFCPLPWGPCVLGKEAGAGPQTDAECGLQLELQLEELEAVEGGEDWPGEGREDGAQRAPMLPVPIEASVWSDSPKLRFTKLILLGALVRTSSE